MVSCLLDSLRDMPFGIELASIFNCELFSVLLGFILNPFAPLITPFGDVLDIFAALLSSLLLVVEF